MSFPKISKVVRGMCNDVPFVIPLCVGGGPIVTGQYIKRDKILLSGADCCHPDVVVHTTKEEIDDTMNAMTESEAKVLFKRVWDVIKEVNTDELYARGGKEWTDFMNDIVLFYVARFKLFNMPMPMIPNVE